MEPIIKEKETVYVDGYNSHHSGGGNLRSKANWALGLGIFGAAAGGAALARQGGIGGILNGILPASSPVTYSASAACPTTCTPMLFEKECDDILNVTKGMYDLYIAGMNRATQAREVDVAEKFGLFINNRNSIDALADKTNAEFFSLYKYTRDKDDETSAKIYDLAQQVAINTAVRPYQDKLIQCEIEKVYTALVNYVDRKTCRMISGQLVLPSEPTVTGYSADCFCSRSTAAANAGA